jgi:hypothetical protein
MQTITIKTYKLSELSKEAKQKAIDDNRFWNTEDNEWYEYTLDYWKEKLTALGFNNAEIYFSGFASQGDGASFKTDVDIEKWLTVNKKKTEYKAIIKDIDNCTITITKSGHYEHEMTMSVEVEYFGNNDKAYNTIDKLGDEILENAREQARLIYKELDKENDYLTSDEAIAESLESNGCDFLEDGNKNYIV